MGKQIKKVTVAVCDRCRVEGDTSEMEGYNEWGEVAIQYRGHTGGRSYDGSAGGMNLDGSRWLCLYCTKDFIKFLNNEATEGRVRP